MSLRVVAVVGVFVALVVVEAYAGATANHELGEFGIDVLFVPVVASAYLLGVRGAVIAASVSAAVALVLFGFADLFSPEVLVTNIVLFCAVGLIVGVLIDRERASTRAMREQSRVMERRHELSLELLATTEAGRLVEANPSWERKLGYTVSSLLGRDFLDFIHPDDRPAVWDARQTLTTGGEVTAQISRFRHSNGGYRSIEWSARRDPDQERNYIAGRDITAKLEAENTLALHREMLERAVAERTEELQRRTAELETTTHDLQLARREDLRRLAMLAEFRDDTTAEHTERVGVLASLIAREVGLAETDVRNLREAAPLHDLGKVGTPDAILLNPSHLSDAERAVMQQHTQLGHVLLCESSSPILQIAAIVALNHHEWWDGTGYPRQLEGTRIPLEARIVALADVFDALTHDRPYKPAWPLTDALQEIAELTGRQFDPEIVEAFQRIPISTLEALIQPGRMTTTRPTSDRPVTISRQPHGREEPSTSSRRWPTQGAEIASDAPYDSRRCGLG